MNSIALNPPGSAAASLYQPVERSDELDPPAAEPGPEMLTGSEALRAPGGPAAAGRKWWHSRAALGVCAAVGLVNFHVVLIDDVLPVRATAARSLHLLPSCCVHGCVPPPTDCTDCRCCCCLLPPQAQCMMALPSLHRCPHQPTPFAAHSPPSAAVDLKTVALNMVRWSPQLWAAATRPDLPYGTLGRAGEEGGRSHRRLQPCSIVVHCSTWTALRHE